MHGLTIYSKTNVLNMIRRKITCKVCIKQRVKQDFNMSHQAALVPISQKVSHYLLIKTETIFFCSGYFCRNVCSEIILMSRSLIKRMSRTIITQTSHKRCLFKIRCAVEKSILFLEIENE